MLLKVSVNLNPDAICNILSHYIFHLYVKFNKGYFKTFFGNWSTNRIAVIKT